MALWSLWVALSDETATFWQQVPQLFEPFESADWLAFRHPSGLHVPPCDAFCDAVFLVAYYPQEQTRCL